MARFGQESREVLDSRIVIINFVGWRPGLVVLGRDSGSEGCGFKSWHHILDGHFFTYICCKNCNVCLKRPKINKKEAGIGPFFKKNLQGNVYIYDITRIHILQKVHQGTPVTCIIKSWNLICRKSNLLPQTTDVWIWSAYLGKRIVHWGLQINLFN